MRLTVIERQILNKFERKVFRELKNLNSEGYLIPGIKLVGKHPLDALAGRRPLCSVARLTTVLCGHIGVELQDTGS